ncbi:GNAT family N-acetyltransferase [Microbacterium sp. CGR1]|uniref:GNAT family N-acetyltransferase n=1 Tax=Microbacterium sp. CGR1 TaxID=1696072 RepID=UPI003DA637B2
MNSALSHSSSGELGLSIHVRESRWDESDTNAVGALVRSYLLQTEAEKHEHGRAESVVPSPAPMRALPPRYEREAADPRASYADCTTLLAVIQQQPVGVVIIRIDGGEAAITRLWADPNHRGVGLGSALLDAALALTSDNVRLSVWDWRGPAIGLYESRGFVRVDSWDDREGLVCMVRPANTLPLR